MSIFLEILGALLLIPFVLCILTVFLAMGIFGIMILISFPIAILSLFAA